MDSTMMVTMPVHEFVSLLRTTVSEEVGKQISELKRQFSEKLISRIEVLNVLGISAPTLWRMEKRGELMPVRVKGKVMYRESDITQLLNQ